MPEINERAERLRDLAASDQFAVVVEAARRTGGERLTDDRLAATVALHFGLLAEGDVVLAAMVNAVARRGVHVGLVVSDLDAAEREAAYQADITPPVLCAALQGGRGAGGLGADSAPAVERQILLSCYDSLWRDHLAGLSRLRERSFSYDDPVAEFRRQAAYQYRVMWKLITRQAVDRFFTIDLTAL